MDIKITPQEIIFLIPTCKNYSDKTNAVRNTWTKQLATYGFRYLFLIGKPELKAAETKDDVLYVPCKDDYESLLLKLVLGYEFFYKNMDFKYVYKIDDDCYPNLKKLVDEILPQLGNREYLGGATHPNGANMNNKWHFGKCSDAKFDKPYKFNVAPFEFAKGGYGYFLHKEVLPLLFELKDELRSELEKFIYSYEDVRIAEVLKRHNILVNSLENYSIISASNYNNSTQYLVYDIQNPGLMILIERQRLETEEPSPVDSPLNHYFDHIYVINLEFEVSNRLTVSEHLKKHGVNFEIFKATNGYKGEALEKFEAYQTRELGDLKRYPKYSELEKKWGHPFIESAGAIGTIYSFIHILKDAKKKEYKRFLIFEDDVLLNNNFENEFGNFIQGIDNDWKMLLLGASQYGWENINIDTAIEKGFYFPKKRSSSNVISCGAFALGLESTVIDELIEAASAFEAPFDNMPMGEIYESYSGKCFIAYPNIVMPDVSDSSIRGKRDQFSHSIKMKWQPENFDYPLNKPSISVLITNKENLKYYSNFSKTRQLSFDLRLFFNSHNGLHPLHNTNLLDAKENKIFPLDEQFFVPSSDYLVKIEEDENLTENDIVKYIEYKQNIRKKNNTPLREIGTQRRKIQKDRVSVIIPIRKQPKDLKQALESVISQDYSSIEVIVVSYNENKSKYIKETRQIVTSFYGKNSNCNVVLLEQTGSTNEATVKNTGIMNSTGEYICFLNEDDIYLPHRLSKSIELLKSTNKTVGAIYCGYLGLDSQKNNLNRYKTGDLTLEVLLLDDQKHYLHTDTVTYKREAILSLNGFDESYLGYQDLEFNIRFFEQYTVDAVKEALVKIKVKSTDHIADEVTLVESKQKFLNQFTYIIERYDNDLEKSIYEVHWAEVKRFIYDINIFVDKIDTNNKEGLLNIIKSKNDKDLKEAEKKLTTQQKKYNKINANNTLLKNKLSIALNSASYKLGHTLIHKKKELVNPKTLLRKIKKAISMRNKDRQKTISVVVPVSKVYLYLQKIKHIFPIKEHKKTIAYCIPIMNREEDLKATLAHNLKIVEKFNGQVKIYINCFDNNMDLYDWVKSTFSSSVYKDILFFTCLPPLPYWHFSWAKNSFKDIIKEDYYSSLDGDNFLSYNEVKDTLKLIKDHDNILIHGFSGQWGDGTSGRLTIPTHFYKKYGYYNDIYPRQFDEIGFMARIFFNEPNILFVHYKNANVCMRSGCLKKALQLNNILVKCMAIDKNTNITSPLNQKGENYVVSDPKMYFYQKFNTGLTFIKLSNNHSAKEYYKNMLNDAVDTLDKSVIKEIVKKSFTFDKFLDTTEEITLYSVIKNDSLFLKDWKKHYETLGIERFVIIDDHSDEDINRELDSKKVTLFKPLIGDFKTCKTIWIKLLLKAFQKQNSWVLTVDSDEFLSIDSTAPTLQELVQQLNNKNKKFITSLMVDMLPNNIFIPENYSGKDYIKYFNKFYFKAPMDNQEYKNIPSIKWAFSDYWEYSYKIDARWNFFDTIDSLRKFSMFKYCGNVELNQGFHAITINNEKILPSLAFKDTNYIFPLKHYKIVKLFTNTFAHVSSDAYHERTDKNIKKIANIDPVKFKKDIDLCESCVNYSNKKFKQIFI